MSLQDGISVGARSGHSRRTGRFVRGNRVYRGRMDRIAEKLDALCATYDSSSRGDMALLATAAVHLCDADVARSRVSRTRATNSALRVLALVRRKPEPQPSIDELLGHSEPADG